MADTPQQDRKLGLPRERRPGGRLVTAYDPALALRIVERVAMGDLVADICRPGNKDGFPASTTFYRWLTEQPALREAYMTAVELSATAFEEEALYLLREYAMADEVPSAGRMKTVVEYVTQLRWSAERRNAKRYSQRASLNMIVPIQINTPLDLGQGGGPSGPSVTAASDVYTIEAKHPTEPPPVDAEFEPVTGASSVPVVEAVKALQNKPLKGWRAKQAQKAKMDARLAKRAKQETNRE